MSQQVSRQMNPSVSKVLIIHNFYQQSGGEDKVVEQESAMLRSRGIETEHYYVHNDSIQSRGLANMAKLAVEAAWSLPEFKRIKKLLLQVKPDVVHVHNFSQLYLLRSIMLVNGWGFRLSRHCIITG